MKTILLRISLPRVKSTTRAAGIAQGAAQHLLDTFNDDQSIKPPIHWEVLSTTKVGVSSLTNRVIEHLREWADECNEIAGNVLTDEESESYETKAREIEQLIREIEGS